MKKILLAMVILIAASGNAYAQATAIINDTSKFAFTASADHSTIFAGTPVLTSYNLELYLKGNVIGGVPSGSPVFNVNLGKPTPAAGEIVTATIKSLAALLPNNEYVYFVRVTGPGGTNRSIASDPFGFPSAPVIAGKPGIQ